MSQQPFRDSLSQRWQWDEGIKKNCRCRTSAEPCNSQVFKCQRGSTLLAKSAYLSAFLERLDGIRIQQVLWMQSLNIDQWSLRLKENRPNLVNILWWYTVHVCKATPAGGKEPSMAPHCPGGNFRSWHVCHHSPPFPLIMMLLMTLNAAPDSTCTELLRKPPMLDGSWLPLLHKVPLLQCYA